MAEMKDARCVSCGKAIQITKFGSLKTCKCEDCKESKAPVNTDILSEIKVSEKPTSSSVPSTGNTKPAKCNKCGADFMVQKFASLKTCVCDECKGSGSSGSYDGGSYSSTGIVIDTSKIDYNMISQNLEGYYIMPASIKNPRLRRVKCPACGHEFMKIVKLLDYSISGIVASYQCSECFLLCNISEQTNHLMLPVAEHVMFNYRGEQIHELVAGLKENKAKNMIDHLLKLLEENNIEVTGIEVPSYIRKIDKPVPTGFNTTEDIESILEEESKDGDAQSK